MGTIDALENAAKRCEGYRMKYPVEITWSLEPTGLRVFGQFGVDKVERFISWTECACADLGREMENLELSVLKGLSS